MEPQGVSYLHFQFWQPMRFLKEKDLSNVLVNGGYWIVTLALMGGVICQFN